VHENQWHPLLKGFRLCLVSLHTSIVVVYHCVVGDGEGVKGQKKEKVEIVQEEKKMEKKLIRMQLLIINHEVLCESARVHECIHCANVCVCML